MSMFPDSQSRRVQLDYATDDKAVFNFFNAVYAWMAAGVAVTAVVGLICSQNMSIMRAVYSHRGVPVLMILGCFALSFAIRTVALNVSAGAGVALFLLYSAIIGVVFSGIFVIYPVSTLAAAFFLTAGLFAALSIAGFIIKRDLTAMGRILIMCFWALFAGSIVNMFMANSMVDWIITYAILILPPGWQWWDH
jgi:FtsH-binding integral membrane protein